MDQGLKERLVGAAVLVAIAVWLIPWVLDGPDEPIDSGSSSLQLPAAEEPVPMRTQTLRLGGDAEEPAVTESTTGPSVSESPAGADVVAEPAATVAAQKPPEAAAPAPSAPVAVTPESRTPAVTAPAARPTATPAAKGDWVVQLGSFGDEDNARRLAQRASTFGYKAGISSHRSGSRTMYRVRVGPFESRGQADATASALTAHGLAGQVVAAD
jgi:DedD protein